MFIGGGSDRLSAYLRGEPYISPPERLDELTLGEGTHPFTWMIRRASRFNKKELTSYHRTGATGTPRALDDLWTILGRYSAAIYSVPDAQPHPAQSILFPCIYKSMFSLYAAHRLTLDGLFGLGRPHLRHAFESLMLAKFCAMEPATDVYDRWIDGVDVFLGKGVIQKITRPEPEEFSRAWKMLCVWTHSTVYAGQVGMDIETSKQEAMTNYGLCDVFVQWIYHLIFSHMVTPTVRYYGDAWTQYKSADRARHRLRRVFKKAKTNLAPGAIQLIKDYKKNWALSV